MEVAVLQKVEPKILGSLKLHVEDDLSAEVLRYHLEGFDQS